VTNAEPVTNAEAMTSQRSAVPLLESIVGIRRHFPACRSAGAVRDKWMEAPSPSRDAAAEAERRNALVVENLHIVKAIAARVRGNLPVHVDMDDLIQAGTIGLMDAANKFDASKQVAFSVYAKHRIKGAMLDSLRELDGASRDLRRLDKEVGSVTHSLTDSLQRSPDESEIAEKLGVSVEKLRAKLLSIRSVAQISISSRANDEAPDLDSATDPETHPDVTFAKKEMQNTVALAMNGLSRNERRVLVLYYNGEKKMREIGGILGVNESRVSQIHKRALRSMEAQLRALGITTRHPL